MFFLLLFLVSIVWESLVHPMMKKSIQFDGSRAERTGTGVAFWHCTRRMFFLRNDGLDTLSRAPSGLFFSLYDPKDSNGLIFSLRLHSLPSWSENPWRQRKKNSNPIGRDRQWRLGRGFKKDFEKSEKRSQGLDWVSPRQGPRGRRVEGKMAPRTERDTGYLYSPVTWYDYNAGK